MKSSQVSWQYMDKYGILLKKKYRNGVKNMKVLGARLIVKEFKKESTKNGIIIPGRETESTNTGKVIAVGNGALLDSGERVPMEVKTGDVVVYTSFSGSPVKVKDETFLILNERDILVVLEEEELSL